MNKLLFFLLTYPIVGHCQSDWKITKSQSTFDGNQRLIYVDGYDGTYPYKKPVVGINENNTISILDFGYISSGDDLVVVKVAFNKNPKTIKSYLFERSDSDIIRLKDLFVNELIDGFNKYNLAEFRVYSDRGDSYEFTISLSGFTKVYNQLLPNGLSDARKAVSFLNKTRIENEIEQAKKAKEEKLKKERWGEIADKQEGWLNHFKNELYPQLIELHSNYPILLKPTTDLYEFDWIEIQKEMYLDGVKPDMIEVNKLKLISRGKWVDLVFLKETVIQTDTVYRKVYSLNFENTFKE